MNYKSFEESKAEYKATTDKVIKQHSKWIEMFNILHKDDFCSSAERKEK